MAQFIMVVFMVVGSGVTYFTYEGIGQETIETVQKESIRSNSHHRGGGYYGGSSSRYNSSSYGYGK